MTYPGNSSLPSDVQTRIRSTFEHTLGLAEKGSRQEALLGCDFVLRMDPLFEPARRLQERLEGAIGPVAVEDLRNFESGAAPAPVPQGRLLEPLEVAPGAAPWADFEGLSLDLPDLPEHPTGVSAGLYDDLETLLAERKFQEVQMRAAQAGPEAAHDQALQRLVALAHERQEAAPYVNRFLTSARDAMRSGNAAEAGRLIEKARSLDPTHPGIAELSGGGRAAAKPAGATTGRPTIAAPPAAATATAAPAFQPAASAGFNLDAPPAAPSGATAFPPAASTLFAPQRTGDSESERRIQQLLDEGQAALDGGDPQAAVDAWSRIFLIDIDHQEAAHRIEAARRIKAERDRQVEESFHDGLAHLEAGDAAAAQRSFQRVVELNPGHVQAREYLQQLADGNLNFRATPPPGRPAPAGRAGGAMPGVPPAVASGAASRQAGVGMPGMSPLGASPAPPPGLYAPPSTGPAPGAVDGSFGHPADAMAGDASLAGAAGAGQDLKEEILVPPEVGPHGSSESRREVRSMSAAPGQEHHARLRFIGFGGAVLLLVLAVGWFIYQKREQWFPNSRPDEPAAVAAAPNPVPRATKLHAAGKTSMALAQLRRVPAGDPHYKEAQALIAKWLQEESQPAGAAPGADQAAGAPGAPGTVTAGAPGALGTDVDRRQQLIAEGRRAYQNGTFLLAAERFEAADRLAKLDATDAFQLADAKAKLQPIERPLALFRGHDWEFALPQLWQLHEANPANKDVTRMIVDSYYDLGVRDLQHNDAADAVKKFGEAKTLAPDDPDLNRQLLFAQTYLEHSTDMLYRIYVKYLPIR